MTVKELRNIIDSIEERDGDLTKRVTIFNNDELATLGNGINGFIEKLQKMLLTISNNSNKMDHIVNEVLESVETSNDMATDLSAITEELSATMVDIAENASLINNNTESVNHEVVEIANKSNEMNEFSITMKQQAEVMQENAMNNSNTTSRKVAEILNVLNKAIRDSESVDEVNKLTDDILSKIGRASCRERVCQYV